MIAQNLQKYLRVLGCFWKHSGIAIRGVAVECAQCFHATLNVGSQSVCVVTLSIGGALSTICYIGGSHWQFVCWVDMDVCHLLLLIRTEKCCQTINIWYMN